MDERSWLAEQFEEKRNHLRAVAYRMLGSQTEAEDAVQEAWLRLSRSGAASIENLGGWLTTVVGRVCLDVLRSRKSHPEEPLEISDPFLDDASAADPEQETLMFDSIGVALLIVLETLTPAERVSFVLHDMFDVSFEEIAAIVGRTPAAARQLASRARRRIQGERNIPDRNLARQREIVEAFVAASRGGHFDALLALLDPNVVVRADRTAVTLGAKTEVLLGAEAVARASLGRAGAAKPALVDGNAGLAVIAGGQPRLVIRFTIVRDKIAAIEIVADPDRLRQLDLKMLDAE